jgi:chaperonin GroEL
MVFLQNLINEYYKNYEGKNVHEVIRGMKDGLSEVKENIKTEAIPNSLDVLCKIANISSNGDKKVVELIKGAYEHGFDVPIYAQDNRYGKNEVEHVRGCLYEEGYRDTTFINTGRGTFEAENAHILIYDGVLSQVEDVKWLFDYIIQIDHHGNIIGRKAGHEKSSIVIICEDAKGQVGHLISLASKFGIDLCLVKLYKTHVLREDVLTDLALMTGATYCNQNKGMQAKSLTPKVLGFAKKVVVKRLQTIFTDTYGETKKIEKRVEEIKDLLKEIGEHEDKAELEKRLKRMQGNIITIHASGKTNSETTDLMARLDDAIRACQSTVEMGAVAGGGASFLRACLSEIENTDYGYGKELINQALLKHIERLSLNYGLTLEQSDEIAYKLRSQKQLVYDFTHKEYGNALELGVLDALKVQLSALENAVSTACELIKTEYILTT